MTDASVLYHGSLTRFDPESFRPMSHFGSIRAALQRAGELLSRRLHDDSDACAFIYPVRLAIRSPFPIADGQNMKHGPCAMADALFYGRRKLLSAAERDRVLSSASNDPEAAFPILASLIRSRGHDGLIYKNRHEDRGQDSFIALDGASVTPDGDPCPISMPEIISWLRELESPQTMPEAAVSLDRRFGRVQPHAGGMEFR